MNTITVDLRNCRTETDILYEFDLVFQFCGPPERNNVDNACWGYNWNAFSDVLSCLDNGGICNRSPIMEFPLHIEILYDYRLKDESPDLLWALYEILSDVAKLYKKRRSLQFEFAFVQKDPENVEVTAS